MLNSYSKNWLKYQELWAKYGERKEAKSGKLPMPMLASQEDSIQWSLKLHKAFEALASESGIRKSDIIATFIDGLSLGIDSNKTKCGLVRVSLAMRIASGKNIANGYVGVSSPNERSDETFICLGSNQEDLDNADKLIERFGLFFNFDSADDLFLEDSSQIKSVILD